LNICLRRGGGAIFSELMSMSPAFAQLILSSN
jgi:hypothetical protein